MELLTFYMVMLSIVRGIGTLVFIEFFIRYRQKRYLVLASGFFLYALSPLVRIMWLSTNPAYISYGILATAGILLLLTGAFAYFSRINVITIIFMLLIIAALPIILNLLYSLKTADAAVVLMQIVLLAGAAIISLANWEKFIKHAGSSIYWLVAIIILGGLNAVGYATFYQGRSVMYAYQVNITLMFMAVIFFVNLEHNLSLRTVKESEKKYRMLADNIGEIIWVLGMDMNISYMSPSVERIMGYSDKEMIGKPVLDFLAPESAEKAMGMIGEELQKEIDGSADPTRVRIFEFQQVKKDGSVIWTDIIASFIRDEHGDISGILGVTRDISERKQAEIEIKKSLNEKEVLLREVHHRVKNNMQVISSLLGLQALYEKDERNRELLTEYQGRVYSMALVHENLYSSGKLAGVDFGVFIEDIIRPLVDSYIFDNEKIKIEIEIDDLSLDADTAIPCAMIINELVTNALKHAFPGKREGNIHVNFSRHRDGNYSFEIIDNGTGIPDTVNIYSSATLGFRLVNALVAQLKGSMEVKSSEGTSMVIIFPGK